MVGHTSQEQRSSEELFSSQRLTW